MGSTPPAPPSPLSWSPSDPSTTSSHTNEDPIPEIDPHSCREALFLGCDEDRSADAALRCLRPRRGHQPARVLGPCGGGVPGVGATVAGDVHPCLLYTSPSPRDGLLSRMPSS